MMRDGRRTDCRDERGLTLIELMVVIAIIGILGTVVAATMTRQDNAGAAKSLAHKVWVTLRSARTIATNVGAVTRVTFTDRPATNTTLITLTRADQMGPAPTSGVWITLSEFEAPKGGHVRCVTLGTDATVDNSTTGCATGRTLEFRPDGRAGAPAPAVPAGGTVYVEDVSGTYKHKVYVYQLTGFSRHVTNW